jgi:integrase
MPTRKLTDLFVRNVKPTPGKRVEYFDASFGGLALRVTETGNKSWALFYRIHGRLRRFTIGSYPAIEPAAARKKATEALEKVELGKDPAAEKAAIRNNPLPDADTFGALWEDYLRIYAKKNMKKRGLYVLQKTIEADVLPRWKNKPLTGDAAIIKRDVLSMVNEIVARGADVHANRVFSKVRAIFNWAISQDRLAVSPMQGLVKPTVETDRERVLTDDELRWFWLACEEIGWPFGPIFRLLLLTLQRRSEVGDCPWTELSVPKATWSIPPERTKNGLSHEVHLSAGTLRVLSKLPKPHHGLLFSVTGETSVSGFSRAKERLDAAMIRIRRRELGLPEDDDAFRKALKIATAKPLPVEIPHWTPHDLRRTATTRMAEDLGIAPHIVDKILNHTSGTIRGVAKIYNRASYLKERRDALSAWSNWLDALTERSSRKRSNVLRLPTAGSVSP